MSTLGCEGWLTILFCCHYEEVWVRTQFCSLNLPLHFQTCRVYTMPRWPLNIGNTHVLRLSSSPLTSQSKTNVFGQLTDTISDTVESPFSESEVKDSDWDCISWWQTLNREERTSACREKYVRLCSEASILSCCLSEAKIWVARLLRAESAKCYTWTAKHQIDTEWTAHVAHGFPPKNPTPK